MSSILMKHLKLGVVSLSAVALLAACGNDTPTNDAPPADDTTEDVADDTTGDTTDDAADDTADDQADSGSTEATAGVLSMTFDISLEDAVQIFRDTFGENVNIDQIDFDSDFGEYEYEIQGWDDSNEYELDIDANTGEVRNQEQEAENDNDDEDILDIASYISPEEAMNAAVSENNQIVEGWNLEIDDGRAIYEIELEQADDIEVDATTGETRR